MTKRKPDKVVVHRIELQSKEREMLEQAMYMQLLSTLGPHLITVLGSISGAYMASAWLHSVAPTMFPAPPFLPDDGTTETAQTNGFIQYAVNLAERRTEEGWTGFLNPFTYWTDVYGAAADAYANQS